MEWYVLQAFSGYENKVKLNENKLKIKYENKKIILNGSSELYIAENEKNTIDFKILKNKDNILFETILNLSKVDLIIDEISYIKKSKQKAILKVKGLNKENNLILKSIIYSENKNRIKIENLKIENNKVSNLDKIEFNYLTENNFKNALYLKRNNNDYELIGKSYDAEKLIAIISDSDTNKNFLDIFNDLNSKVLQYLVLTELKKRNCVFGSLYNKKLCL